ncbi:MAG: hypothetical protein ACOC80_00720 [Petrotogales bacterium]
MKINVGYGILLEYNEKKVKQLEKEETAYTLGVDANGLYEAINLLNIQNGYSAESTLAQIQEYLAKLTKRIQEGDDGNKKQINKKQ